MPNQEWLTAERPKQYTPQHFFVGAVVVLKSYVFDLVTADEFSLAFMEDHPFEYPKSNVNLIMTKIRDAIQPIYKNFIAKYLLKVQNTLNDKGQPVAWICFNTLRFAAVLDSLSQ